MNDNQNGQVPQPSQRPQPLLAIYRLIFDGETKRIAEYLSCNLKGDSVPSTILPILLLIPVESHLRLSNLRQYVTPMNACQYISIRT